MCVFFKMLSPMTRRKTLLSWNGFIITYFSLFWLLSERFDTSYRIQGVSLMVGSSLWNPTKKTILVVSELKVVRHFLRGMATLKNLNFIFLLYTFLKSKQKKCNTRNGELWLKIIIGTRRFNFNFKKLYRNKKKLKKRPSAN